MSDDQYADLLAQLKAIEGSTWQENRDSRRLGDFKKLAGGMVHEVRLATGRNDFRALALHRNLSGEGTLVVGRVISRETANKPRRKASIADRAVNEISDYIARR